MTHLVNMGSPCDRASIALETRKRTWIPNARKMERAPEALRAAARLWKEKIPTARLRSSTAVYNCFGMVFASRRTWVDSDALPTILKDDEYGRVDNPSQVEIGDLVIYCDSADRVTHIGAVVNREPDCSSARWEITVMSKWGEDGEYIHPLNDLPPLLGKATEFRTERRPKP